ncbi:hypothetical protein JJV70_00790 [Streptomyces sp. JJ66]|uniref:DUF7848 domain-containing protein n=1 Tax=Streptomyces sp. JJ66 TaxID=2803843 RepID=UPI001C570EF3|nr:hypothetical protein [Streptomyces sp. JJ66]MBW1600665.1 hypothetical protein [Streptomyces sp. JJ66]
MRERYGFWRFRVEADLEPDAEPRTFTPHCAVCGDRGPVVEAERQGTPETQEKADHEARTAAAGWIETHRSVPREHLSYRLTATTPYRIVPGAWE